MSKQTDNDSAEVEDWLFDSVVGYLSSPIFRNPIEHFYEQNCSVFSPDISNPQAVNINNDSDDETIVPGMFVFIFSKQLK